ncbi:hypothetical protein CEUSTIGMA_g13222.t1 [Chlamydomonas eustigma]|uniref:Uncharacterized protein n=1 Tax=Chlamydomonas eustigma TaxID=1157962 RepID=A0A250XRU2_9CHLO|nr:hypothetical protein CEUSTIGMA_g13222.t1 [Chlamydomonas eustigma]|eukprot:GAX85807.1 hypothetical protein CEUSTIGMA_g13222.t1 [Chlamydomonas eustigma]
MLMIHSNAQGWIMDPSMQVSWKGHAAKLDAATQHVRWGEVAFWLLAGEDFLPQAPVSAVEGDESVNNTELCVNNTTVTRPAPTSIGAGAAAPSSTQTNNVDIWTSDPYALIDKCRPGLTQTHNSRHLMGASYQTRVLAQLALALKEAGGDPALQKTHIVLHLNDEQQEAATRMIWNHKFYGFKRENFVIVPQSRRSGYCYEPSSQRFVATEAGGRVMAGGAGCGGPESTGTGIAAMQLNWCPDAFVMSPEGLVETLHVSPAELLSERGVVWLSNFRAKDLTLFGGGKEVLDVPFVAKAMQLREKKNASIMTKVILSDAMSTARSMDSIVLSRGGVNTELRMSDIVSHHMQKSVSIAKAEIGGKVAVGVQRYMFHVPSLKKILTSNVTFRPRMRLKADMLYLNMDMADISSAPGAIMATLQVPEPPVVISGTTNLETLLTMAERQDKDSKFVSYLTSLNPNAIKSASIPNFKSLAPAAAVHSSTTVVFVGGVMSSIPAIRLALALARPGKDVVNLVTFVADDSQLVVGQIMLSKVMTHFMHKSVEVRTDVVVRGGSSLLDSMQKYVELWAANLVIVPSIELANPKPEATLGSVALSIIRRLEVPALVVTPKAAKAMEVLHERQHLRLLLMVEGWSMPLLNYSCDRLLVAKRGDNLLLGQVYSSQTCTSQQKGNMRRHLSDFTTIAHSRSVQRIQELLLDGLYHEAVSSAVEDYHINLVGIQLPPGPKALPKSLISLLSASKAGVLIMKQGGSSSSRALF